MKLIAGIIITLFGLVQLYEWYVGSEKASQQAYNLGAATRNIFKEKPDDER